jgi:hypothetical protein
MELEFILTETAAEQWLKHFVETNSTSETLDFYEGTIGDFDRGLKALFGIEAARHIEQQHVVLYYYKYLDYLQSGIMSRRHAPSNLTEDEDATKLSLHSYMRLHLSIIKRFLAFCWAQEYIAEDFPRWRWTDYDLEKISFAYRNGC